VRAAAFDPDEALEHADAVEPRPARPRLALGRGAWIAVTLLLMGWQASLGRSGLSLVLLAAAVPLLVLASMRSAAGTRLGAGWLGCVLAPVLGLAGLAGAFPALAGQLRGWRVRALAGAIGYWWLTLAEPLAGRRLWVGPHAGTPARSAWESSPASAVVHVVGPLLGTGLLLGVLLWAGATAALPWLVRGRSAAVDAVAVTVWSAALVSAAAILHPAMGSGAHAAPRGAVLGAVLGGLIALAGGGVPTDAGRVAWLAVRGSARKRPLDRS
jgi:hypothetical protein